jgi:hypothetical protein
MRIFTTLMIAACLLLVLVAGCKSLAMTGKEKYKVDLNNAFMTIRDQITNDGTASEKAVTKLEDLLTAYRAEFSGKGSFIEAEKALEALKLAASEPDKAFGHNQVALTHAAVSQDYLKTEAEGA